MVRVFLSASIPLPHRNAHFFQTADVVAIREAVKALVGEVVPKGQLVFGGHPAITPLIALLMRGFGEQARRRVVLYQSAYFQKHFVSENDDFLDVRLIPAVGRSRKRSIAAMRKRMIEDTPFDAAVFVGGMEGILDEFNLFVERHGEAHIWPVASTGAAALQLFHKIGSPKPDLFLNEFTYSTLFRKLVSEL